MDIQNHLKIVEEHEDYKVLKRAKRVTIFSEEPIADPIRVLVVDTETTGTTPTDQIIENAAVLVEVCKATGRVGRVLAVNEGLQEPTVPIDPAAQKVHGITAEMVKGCAINKPEYCELYESADLVIAHNAEFDRPFIERFFIDAGLPINKPWGCTYREINWADRGFSKSGLEYLVIQSGYFHGAHRAADDVFALIYCLATKSEDHGYPLSDLLARIKNPAYMIKTTNTFDFKESLKSRGYFYEGQDKSWCKIVSSATDVQAEVKEELRVLRDEILLDSYGIRKGRVFFGKRDVARKYTQDPYEFTEMNLENLRI